MRLLYRCLLFAYPASLRAEYGVEMATVLDEAWRTASQRGWRSRVHFAAQILSDFVRSLPGAWREPAAIAFTIQTIRSTSRA